MRSWMREKKQPRRVGFEVVFGDKDLEGMEYPHIDLMIVAIRLGPMLVRKGLVDSAHSVNLL